MLRGRLISLILGIAALLLTLAAPATAAPASETLLVVSVHKAGEPSRHATVRCEPAGGTHPRAADFCGELAKARGDLRNIYVGPDRPCYLIYDPITVSAVGLWRGRPIAYRETFPNDCVLAVHKGTLFQF